MWHLVFRRCGPALSVGASVMAAFAACRPAPPSDGPAMGASSGGSAGLAAGTAGAAGSAGTAGSGLLTIDAGATDAQAGSCTSAPDEDADLDGFTINQGDCGDCDAAANPGAYDFAGNGIDEDCNGVADDEPVGCDASLAIAADDPMDAARALGLCRVQQGASWGVVAARWVHPNGDATSSETDLCEETRATPHALSRGILSSFGPNVSPRDGASVLALSSGIARAGKHEAPPPAVGVSPAGATLCVAGSSPDGFPKDSPACPDVETAEDKRANDGIALELEIKTPTNARSFSFDFDFYTYEWPQYVCSVFNDFFVALLKSTHPQTPPDENVSFDAKGNPVSVNNGFVEVCDPLAGALQPGGKFFACALGTAELEGTGFDEVDGYVANPDLEEPKLSSHAATGWLKTSAAVVPGETIRLRFAIWDMSDGALDSTVLLDHFTWTLTEAMTPVTERVPPVK